GAGGEAAQAFKALQVNVQNADGTLKSSSDMLAELADKFAGLEDSAAKTALAIAIFGKGGAGMIPLLNEGSKGLGNATDEARKFGLVVDGQTAQAAAAFNDNLKRVNAAMAGMITQITAGMLPTMEQLSNAFVTAAKDSEGLTTASNVIAG